MKRLFAGVLLTAVMAAPAMAAGDPAAGKAKSAICAACHGAEGIAAIPSYPNLKGQNAQYLTSALKAYQNKERTGAMAQVMQPMAGMLNDQDIANLAAYYSQLK
ncbi:cytochrome c [Photobacterium japonica]|uniref:c-type cytochrome n=1 Tax=Photobacterium japonica TaxID=2910235 RepID=UPI003D0A0CC0